MSMQRILNYGSSLQAFALRRLIERLGNDVQVTFVDYEPGATLLKGAYSDDRRSNLGRTLAKVREYNDAEARLADKLRFLNHKRTYAKRYFPMLGLSAARNHDLDLDVQVIGSDEVFNCVQSNTNVGYSRDLFGHNSPARRVISYAGSFGNTTLEKIEGSGIREHLEEDFARFTAISVRDRNSAGIIEALTGRTPTLNADPAIAYDYMRLEGRVPQDRQYEPRYIIVYGYSGRLTQDENELIKQYARSTGARVLCFGGVQDCCDRFVDCSPFELLAYFRDADAVITDTFHGTIFSIVNNVPFATIVRPSVDLGYGNEEKLGFFLETFGLETQQLTEVADIDQVLTHPIDYASVNRKLEMERANAVNYLATNIV